MTEFDKNLNYVFIGMDEKICKICNRTKSLEQFDYRLEVQVDYCKSCLLAKKARFEENGINLPIEYETS